MSNDFLNSLMADPDEHKLPRVIDAVGRLGSDYFCVDGGWYADADAGATS